MNENAQSPSLEFISQIEDMMRYRRDCPHGFPEAFKRFAENWPEQTSYKSPTLSIFQEFGLEERPYTESELARQPGTPSRGTIFSIRKDLLIPFDEQRYGKTHQLRIEVIRMILERLKGSPSKEKTMSESDDSDESDESDEVSITEELANMGYK